MRALPVTPPRDWCQWSWLGGPGWSLWALQPSQSPAQRTLLAQLWHHEKAERVTLISLSIANAAVILSTARSLLFLKSLGVRNGFSKIFLVSK